MEKGKIAGKFKALGDVTSLQIFNLLRGCCCPAAVEETRDVRPVDGPTVGAVCCHVTCADRINSAISHYVRELRLAGLVAGERRGEIMIYGVNYKAVDA